MLYKFMLLWKNAVQAKKTLKMKPMYSLPGASS